MNIGIVCYPTFGGSGVIATELGKGLAEKGHRVHFIAYRQPARLDRFHENICFHDVRFSNYPLFEYPPYETALASKIVDVVRTYKLDVLHVHYAIPHAATAWMAKKVLEAEGRSLAIVTTLHGTDITLVGRDITYLPVVTFSINCSDGVTAVSESLRADTYRNFVIDRSIEVIPNFIDFSRFQKTNKEHFRKAIAPNGERILLHTSNFRPVKRVADVVRVFQRVRAEMPAKLLLLGDGPDRQTVEQLCRELGVMDDVRFLGKQDAVEEILAVADVFLLPSEMESFGLAALEAMACEVPVISSDAGGIPETNVHGETGFVSRIGDVDDMAHNAIRLLQDDALLTQFRKNAYAQARKFDLQHVLPMYESYYEKVVDEVLSLKF
jgi:N-acetyl-alpha-D-glucosaminyl L-malate synthase BshA